MKIAFYSLIILLLVSCGHRTASGEEIIGEWKVSAIGFDFPPVPRDMRLEEIEMEKQRTFRFYKLFCERLEEEAKEAAKNTVYSFRKDSTFTIESTVARYKANGTWSYSEELQAVRMDFGWYTMPYRIILFTGDRMKWNMRYENDFGEVHYILDKLK